ncbi:hypothetical protein BDR04DRAFT_232070 [Suillus decipiens]|nr:hypothetical protein BDR04DRAFT_232070 [Suillus decipiens]
MWYEQHTIAWVIIATTVFGFLFYSLTVLAALVSPACPFQTPVSTVLRMFQSCRGPTSYGQIDLLASPEGGNVGAWCAAIGVRSFVPSIPRCPGFHIRTSRLCVCCLLICMALSSAVIQRLSAHSALAALFNEGR